MLSAIVAVDHIGHRLVDTDCPRAVPNLRVGEVNSHNLLKASVRTLIGQVIVNAKSL